jgi:ribosome biogenesis GTPase
MIQARPSEGCMSEGRVIRTYNSFYYVHTETGMITCKLRGKMKKGRESVVTGDFVALEELPDGTGIIEKRLPRQSFLRRPAVANIDQVVLTFAARQPDLHPLLLNRFLVLAEWSGISKILLCVNKTDLLASAEEKQTFLAEYAKVGYDVLRVSVHDGIGIEELRGQLQGKATVFAGPSGVGKSSLLNAVDTSLALATGRISKKIKRGRHTTRIAQLLPYADGYIVDTPGFSVADFSGLDLQALPTYFPEFVPFLGKCRYQPCTHSHEPQCAVKEAVQQGLIADERYQAYLHILQEVKELQERKRAY